MLPPLAASLQTFIAIDEGLDRLIRVAPQQPLCVWTLPIAGKSRSLQRLADGTILAVTDTGYMEIDTDRGCVIRDVHFFKSGVISAERLPNGHTFFGGLNLGQTGVTFVEIDAQNKPFRTVVFPGDYVRRSTPTLTDTILFTCNSRVYEGDWSGRILREFSAPGFKHAWKAIRTDDDHTVISAGYGAFIVEFSDSGRILRKWECATHASTVRPNFFGDFHLLPDGGMMVCNWLGHGTDLGGTGYPLLEFSPRRELVGGWQDASRTSSLQTVIFTN